MIVFVSTGSHTYTHRYVGTKIAGFRMMSYPEIFLRNRLPKATYIFSDFDRLSFFQLELAGHLFRQLAEAGCRVLNDPARALQRLELLQGLYRSHLNTFKAWSAAQVSEVDRFPVFIRKIRAHRGVLTDLICDSADLSAQLDQLVGAGMPASDLMIAEYAAEPNAEGVFRKLSVYKVGPTQIATPSVHERHWAAKYGEKGSAGKDGYIKDLETVRTNPFKDHIEKVFDLAKIDYGRVDFGIVHGHPEVYEINTNPMIEPTTQHPYPERIEAFRLSDLAYLEALKVLDTPHARKQIEVRLPDMLAKRRRRTRLWPGYQWMP